MNCDNPTCGPITWWVWRMLSIFLAVCLALVACFMYQRLQAPQILPRKMVDHVYQMLVEKKFPVTKLTGETNRCHLADRSCCQVQCESEPTLVSFPNICTLSLHEDLINLGTSIYLKPQEIHISVRAFTDHYWVFNWTSFDFYGSRLSDERFLPAGERNTIVTSFADPNQTLASI